MNSLILELLKRPSISPEDAGCQALLADSLLSLGFETRELPFGEVKNLWAKLGKQANTLLFLGHTDVVPPGPIDQWKFDPFTPTCDQGKLYARGAADMKVAITCMVEACRRFLHETENPKFNIAFLITSCEEANTEDGTEKAIKFLIEENQAIPTWCLVGEPSADMILGDQIKVGRRGSLHGELKLYGKQGHIAYPHRVQNPIHLLAPALKELTEIVWDEGNDYFEPTSFQLSNLHSGTGALNVTPADLSLFFNFRYSPASDVDALKNKVETLLKRYQLHYDIVWQHTSQCFLSPLSKLHEALQEAINIVTGKNAKASTSGGTSDGRFIAPYGVETIECGFPNRSIHQVNENINIADIEKLTDIYYLALCHLQNKS